VVGSVSDQDAASPTKGGTMEKNIDQYVAPKIEDHGDLTELTAGKNAGSALDATFPVGTPFSDITLTTP
jgi:hypothetical protein